MKRIGFLGVNAVTESLVGLLFGAFPDAQIFISPGSSESAQRMATASPCWTLDNVQSVVNEADIIFIGTDRSDLSRLASDIDLRSEQTLISLIPGIQIGELQRLFNHHDIVRLSLIKISDSGESLALMTASVRDVEVLFSTFTKVIMRIKEHEFNILENNEF